MNICFITNELHPSKPGGIGRLMYNFAVQNRDHSANKCNFYFLVASSEVNDSDELISYYRDNELGTVVMTPPNLSFFSKIERELFESLPVSEYSSESQLRKSLEYFNGLLYLENKFDVKLDYIEFPDYGGWGFSTLAAKLSGLHFHGAKIAVRLHSTSGLIRRAEPYYHRNTKADRSFVEIEKQCLENADFIVSHLSVITEENRQFYNFGDDWLRKVIEEFPPLFLEDDEVFGSDSVYDNSVNFIFSSRLQPFKRPDTFVRAAVLFLQRHSNYKGNFFVVSYGWDGAYIEWLKSLVSVEFEEKIIFLLNAESEVRNKLLQSSVVVIPSTYESLCLFAYESSLRGSKIILNGNCVAFGDGGLWKDGKNCIKFDGSEGGLSLAFDRALSEHGFEKIVLPESLCYWHNDSLNLPLNSSAKMPTRLAVIGFGFESYAQVNEKIIELSDLLDSRITYHFFVPKAETSEISIPEYTNIVFHFTVWSQPLACELNDFMESISDDLIAFIGPQVQVDHRLYSSALDIYSENKDFDIFTSHVRALTHDDLKNSRWQEGNRNEVGGRGYLKTSCGGAPSVVSFDLNTVSEFSCFSRHALCSLAGKSDPGTFYAKVMVSSMVNAGRRVLVLPSVYITEKPAAKTERFLSDEKVLDTLSFGA